MPEGIKQIETAQPYDYASPFSAEMLRADDSFVLDLLETRALKRLNTVMFLGGIDYCYAPRPNRFVNRFNRLQHSLGVLRLALTYANKLELPARERRVVLAAALLHDVGHAPFSHSAEPIFKTRLGVSHHEATLKIITGKTALGRDVKKILASHNVDIDYLVDVLSGRSSDFDDFFGGPINFDTIEGILRTFKYTRLKSPRPSPLRVLEAAMLRRGAEDKETVDSFWRYKDQVYRYIIGSPIGQLADRACQHAILMDPKYIRENFFYMSEKETLLRLPLLLDTLKKRDFSEVLAVHEGIEYSVRRFYIDQSTTFFERNDRSRYRQRKESKRLHSAPTSTTVPSGETGELAYDFGP